MVRTVLDYFGSGMLTSLLITNTVAGQFPFWGSSKSLILHDSFTVNPYTRLRRFFFGVPQFFLRPVTRVENAFVSSVRRKNPEEMNATPQVRSFLREKLREKLRGRKTSHFGEEKLGLRNSVAHT